MNIATAIIDMFRSSSPERENEKRLTRARLELGELQCNLEATTAHVAMLQARIARLEQERADNGPISNAKSAPHKGPALPEAHDWARSNVGSTQMPSPRMRGATA